MKWLESFWKRLMAPGPGVPRVFVQTRDQPTSSGETLGTFTPRAQQVLALAREEAARFHHNVVGTEHLLLGLIALGRGVAVNVMLRMGLDLEAVRAEVKKAPAPIAADESSGKVAYTPRVKKVLDLAKREAKALQHTYVGTEHILLGLLAEGNGAAARVLRALDLDLEMTREEVLKELDPNFTPGKEVTNPSPSAGFVSVRLQGEPVDTSKRYDVYCTDWSQGVVVYRNARFKGVKHLFQESQYDTPSVFVELEQENSQTVFVSRSSIIRFTDPGT